MKLYLVRHGEALEAPSDSARPLSENGWKEVSKIAKFVAENNIVVKDIYHSEKLRAQQTASGLSKSINPSPKVAMLPGLLPNDDVRPITIYANQWNEDTMLVGHLPFLGKLVSEVLFERDDKYCVEFQTASMICLQRIATYQWIIAWFISPNLLN